MQQNETPPWSDPYSILYYVTYKAPCLFSSYRFSPQEKHFTRLFTCSPKAKLNPHLFLQEYDSELDKFKTTL